MNRRFFGSQNDINNNEYRRYDLRKGTRAQKSDR